MAEKPTRRELLVQITAGTAASGALSSLPAQAQTAHQPRNVTASQFRLLTILVDMIIPPSDTPGAAAAGVDRIIDEALVASDHRRDDVMNGLAMLEEADFGSMDEESRVRLLTEYSQDTGAQRRFFRALKELTVQGYYTTEIGLVEELGYKGNDFLREFPGCQHQEHH